MGFIIICLVSSIVWAEEKPPYLLKAELFLTKVMEGQIDEAYDKIFQDSIIPKLKPQMLDFVKRQTAIGVAMYGKLLGFEFIKQQKYGASIVRVVYTLKAEQLPLTWEFYFYKPKSDWILVNVTFNDQFDLLADK